jgi:hypothetical protein
MWRYLCQAIFVHNVLDKYHKYRYMFGFMRELESGHPGIQEFTQKFNA